MQKSYTTSLGAPKVPKVLWSDVGGLHGLKLEIMRTINLPLLHPNLLKITGLKRSGWRRLYITSFSFLIASIS